MFMIAQTLVLRTLQLNPGFEVIVAITNLPIALMTQIIRISSPS